MTALPSCGLFWAKFRKIAVCTLVCVCVSHTVVCACVVWTVCSMELPAILMLALRGKHSCVSRLIELLHSDWQAFSHTLRLPFAAANDRFINATDLRLNAGECWKHLQWKCSKKCMSFKRFPVRIVKISTCINVTVRQLTTAYALYCLTLPLSLFLSFSLARSLLALIHCKVLASFKLAFTNGKTRLKVNIYEQKNSRWKATWGCSCLWADLPS